MKKLKSSRVKNRNVYFAMEADPDDDVVDSTEDELPFTQIELLQ